MQSAEERTCTLSQLKMHQAKNCLIWCRSFGIQDTTDPILRTIFRDNQSLFFYAQFLRNLPQKNGVSRKNQFVKTPLSREQAAGKKYCNTLKSVSQNSFETWPFDAVLQRTGCKKKCCWHNSKSVSQNSFETWSVECSLAAVQFKWTKPFLMKYICHHRLHTSSFSSATQMLKILFKHMLNIFLTRVFKPKKYFDTWGSRNICIYSRYYLQMAINVQIMTCSHSFVRLNENFCFLALPRSQPRRVGSHPSWSPSLSSSSPCRWRCWTPWSARWPARRGPQWR